MLRQSPTILFRLGGVGLLMHQTAAGKTGDIGNIVVNEGDAVAAIAQHGIDPLQEEATLVRRQRSGCFHHDGKLTITKADHDTVSSAAAFNIR